MTQKNVIMQVFKEVFREGLYLGGEIKNGSFLSLSNDDSVVDCMWSKSIFSKIDLNDIEFDSINISMSETVSDKRIDDLTDEVLRLRRQIHDGQMTSDAERRIMESRPRWMWPKWMRRKYSYQPNP